MDHSKLDPIELALEFPHGNKIVKAYHVWAKNDYDRLMDGIKSRDASLTAFINSTAL